MNKVCPITDKRTDENVARFNALITVTISILFVLTGWWLLLAFLVADFAIRGFADSHYSPICQMSRSLVKTIGLGAKPVNAGPKIFAAQIGLSLSALALILFAFDCGIVCMALVGMLAFFAFLETAFGFCLACKIYPFFRRV
jgi:hypothetical protein